MYKRLSPNTDDEGKPYHIYIYICMYVYIYICMYVCMYVCMSCMMGFALITCMLCVCDWQAGNLQYWCIKGMYTLNNFQACWIETLSTKSMILNSGTNRKALKSCFIKQYWVLQQIATSNSFWTPRWSYLRMLACLNLIIKKKKNYIWWITWQPLVPGPLFACKRRTINALQ